jgi:hypothetical protein
MRRLPLSLRGWFVRLALISLLGAIATAAAAGWFSWREQLAQLGVSLKLTARALVVAVDREINQAAAIGHTLAASRSLAAGNLDAFAAEAGCGVKTLRLRRGVESS